MAFLWHLIVYLWRQLYLNQNKFYTMKKTFENAPCLWWLSFKCYRLFQIVRTFWGQITLCLWGLLSSAIVCFTKWGHFEDNYLRFFGGGLLSSASLFYTEETLRTIYLLSVRATLPVPKSVLHSEDTLRTHSASSKSASLMPRFKHCLLFSFQQWVNAAKVSWSMTVIKYKTNQALMM